MIEQEALDTGVLFGFCIRSNPHHKNCKEYLMDSLNDGRELFATLTVRAEYNKSRETAVDDYIGPINEHIAEVRKSDYLGRLSPAEVRAIRDNFLPNEEGPRELLQTWYVQEINGYISKKKLIERLKGLKRDIEQRAYEREKSLHAMLEPWRPSSYYPDIRDSLKPTLHEPDLTICAEAHDIAECQQEPICFVTANPSDFKSNSTEREIKKNTDIDKIKSIANTSSEGGNTRTKTST